nr:hypothetical protein [Tanacetum cinerariifolium]
MAKLAFFDYHNKVAILEKTEHNIDFHQIVDFLKASNIRYALTISPTVYVSHVRQFWSTARIESRNKDSHYYEPASLLRDDSQGEAFPTVSSLDAGQDRENINKTSTLPHESSPRVPTLDADESSMQQRLHELMEICTSLQRQQSQIAAKIKDQDLEISGLKARVKFLEDKNRGIVKPTQEHATIKWGIKEIGEEVRADKSTELGSNDTEEMVNVLSSIKAANIFTSEVAVASVSPAAGVPTVSGSFPTISVIFTTVSVVTPYIRRPRGITIGGAQHMRSPIIGAKDKGKQKVVESERVSEQIARDSKIARLHAEEELKIMIEGLDRSNEMIAKHLQEYEQAAADLSVGEKIELTSELVKYQEHRTKILKGMTLEQIKEKFIPVWKQLEDFMPMSSKEEGERVKRQGLKINQWSSKRMKTSKDVSKEDLKGMMQLVSLEEVYVEALQVKHPIIDWEIHSEEKREEDLHQLWTLVKETFSIRLATKDKEQELWVELKRLFELDFEDHLWTHNQAFMHDPLDWKLYETCGVYHVFTKDQEIFMLFDREDLHQLWTLVKETFSIRLATKDKEQELWVELKRLFELDFEDHLWTHNQAFMHDPLDWKLYETCGVYHVFTKDQEIFMLVERIIH